MAWLAVFLGGGIGASLRYALSLWLHRPVLTKVSSEEGGSAYRWGLQHPIERSSAGVYREDTDGLSLGTSIGTQTGGGQTTDSQATVLQSPAAEPSESLRNAKSLLNTDTLDIYGLFELIRATLAANLIGSLLIGAVLAFAISAKELDDSLRLLLMVGFCGGLTTFSSFSLEGVDLIAEGYLRYAILYSLVQVAGCFVSVYIGFMAVSKVLARANLL